MASLTLPLWGPKSNDQPKLHDVLGRVAHERGHFRDITEASLQEEIATEGAIPFSSTDDDESEDDDDDDDDDEHEATGPSTLEEVIKMRQEMHALVATTLSTDVSLLLDTVSLALSRYKPDAAKTTLSAVLQQQGIPLGSLGTDVWHRMPEDTAREEGDERIATHVRLEGLRESANALLAAATRLNENVRKETQYWERVLSISEKGWNVCRIPGPQRLLGVTFGFSESAPEFSRRGIAALTTTEEGDLTLGRGFGRKAKALRVVIKRHGQVVGISRTPETNTEDEGQLTLDQRIRRARDSLFDEELYHEMIREARTVANFGVHTTRDGILFTPDPTPSDDDDDDSNIETLFQLLPLPDHDTPPSPPPPATPLAQTLALAARLLLSRAHREKLTHRTHPPTPLSTDTPPTRPHRLPILRPLMSLLLHRTALHRTNHHLARLHNLLTTANLHPTPLHPARLTSPPNQNISTAAALTDALLDPWRSTAVLVAPPLDLRVHVETTLGTAFGPVFAVSGAPGRKFDDFESARRAVDGALAVALARALAGEGSGWEWEEGEALLVRRDWDGEARHVWVVVDGVAGRLAVCSGRRRVEWRVAGEGEGEGEGEGPGDLWEVWERVLE